MYMKRVMPTKYIILMLLLFSSFTYCNTECEGRLSKDECIEKPQCLFAMNSYNIHHNSECLMMNSIDEVKQFCSYFIKLNHDQGFRTVYCQSSSYKPSNNDLANDSKLHAFPLSLIIYTIIIML